MKNRPKIFLDLDATTLDWSSPVARRFNIDLPNDLPNGMYPYFGDDDTKERERLNAIMETYSFWTDLEPYSWALEMIEIASQYGEVNFLSKARPNGACMAGKMDTIIKYFPEYIENVTFVTKDKSANAYGNILIDDDLHHKEPWESNGGEFFHWAEIRDIPENAPVVGSRLINLRGFLYHATK